MFRSDQFFSNNNNNDNKFPDQNFMINEGIILEEEIIKLRVFLRKVEKVKLKSSKEDKKIDNIEIEDRSSKKNERKDVRNKSERSFVEKKE